MGEIDIYIPEKEYEEKEYRELLQKRLEKKLSEELKAKLQGKLQDKDIDKIIERTRNDIFVDVKIKIITDPFEYGNKMMEKEDETTEDICGDIKPGKYKNDYIEKYECTRKQIISVPNFTLGEVQANAKDEYEESYSSGKRVRVGRTLTIYVPEKEYEEKDYKELVHNQKRDNLIQKIMEQTKGNISLDEVRQIADRLADKIEPDEQIIITTSPYEYYEKCSDKIRRDRGYITEDVELEGDRESDENFSLNKLQARRIETGFWSNEEQMTEFVEEYYMYIPNESYIEGASFADLCDLDYKLEQARDLIEYYNSTYYKTHPEESRKEEAEEQYAQAMEEKRKLMEDREV